MKPIRSFFSALPGTAMPRDPLFHGPVLWIEYPQAAKYYRANLSFFYCIGKPIACLTECIRGFRMHHAFASHAPRCLVRTCPCSSRFNEHT